MPHTRGGTEITSVVFTSTSTLALWDTARFDGIVDYDTWELSLLDHEDLAEHIEAGALVPMEMGGDGNWKVRVRIGTPTEPADLTEREQDHLAVSAAPYLLVSTGEVRLSGLEAIGADLLPGTIRLMLPAGRYTVSLCQIDWAREPGSRTATGEPRPDALPDLVILIDGETPKTGPADYRICPESFHPLVS